ncbi:MAG: Uma2 family endonuclease [Chitinophagales bacterium]
MSAGEKLNPEPYTFEEYLALEEKTEHKSEYHNGRIYAMLGGSFSHSIIGGNMTTALNKQIEANGKKCRASNSDLMVYIESVNKSVYPDVAVVCDKPEFKDKNKIILLNPMLIVEVLSKSTAAYDRGEKFRMYQQLPSFKEYLIVSQDQPKVECFYRESKDLWRISYAVGLDKSIHLYSMDCDIPLTEIYSFIEFEEGVQTELDFD